ncbi:MAG: D-alanyl-D-alanine carboxypeptidase family protein [Novosphingobium sp.]
MVTVAVAAAGPVHAAAPTSAPIAIMVDLGSNRVLFERDAHHRFPPASLTKIMTAYVAFEAIAAGRLKPEQAFVVNHSTWRRWHGVGSTLGLRAGERVPVDVLLAGTMTVSANDAAIVLAEGMAGSVPRFAALMNAEAARLGLKDSHFATPNGWPDGGATYTSAADLAVLTKALIERHPALYRRYVGRADMTWNGVRQLNRIPVQGLVGADGVKTGFTRESGYGFVGSAVRDGRRVVMVVAGLGSESARAAQARSFLDWGFDAWQARRVAIAGERFGQARVQQGAQRSVALLAPSAYFVTTPRGAPADARLKVRYFGPLRAPLRRGQRVAELVVSVSGQGDQHLPLVAAGDVAAAGPWARLRNGLLLLGLVGR